MFYSSIINAVSYQKLSLIGSAVVLSVYVQRSFVVVNFLYFDFTFQMSHKGNLEDELDRFRPHLEMREWAVLNNIFSTAGRNGKNYKLFLQGFKERMPSEVRKRVKKRVLEIRKAGTVPSDIKDKLYELCSPRTLKELKLFEIVKGTTNNPLCIDSPPTLGENNVRVPASFLMDNHFVPCHFGDCENVAISSSGTASEPTSSILLESYGIGTVPHKGELYMKCIHLDYR